MNSTFCYIVWGIYPKEDGYKDSHWFTRRAKIDNDIKLYQLNPYSPLAVVYVFGEENYRRLNDLGLNVKMIDRRPYVFDLETQQYAHKLLGYQVALSDYESIVALDFDTIPLKPIPNNFWDVMNDGEPIKTPLYVYHLKRVNRPPNDNRKVSSASFIYLRNKETADGIFKTWEDMGKPWKEEYAITKFIDDREGGWKGVKNYAKYDVPFYQMSILEELPKPKEQLVFGHYNHRIIKHLIGNGVGVEKRLVKFEKNLYWNKIGE